MGEDRRQEGRKHIFAINGAPEFLNLIRDLFQEEAYNVTTTNYVPNSFAQVLALQPDALVVDIVIGQSAGWELLEQLHAGAAATGIPVLVLSTSPHLLVRARDQAERYGNHRYLDKPFELEALLTAIREMIGQAWATRTRRTRPCERGGLRSPDGSPLKDRRLGRSSTVPCADRWAASWPNGAHESRGRGRFVASGWHRRRGDPRFRSPTPITLAYEGADSFRGPTQTIGPCTVLTRSDGVHPIRSSPDA